MRQGRGCLVSTGFLFMLLFSWFVYRDITTDFHFRAAMLISGIFLYVKITRLYYKIRLRPAVKRWIEEQKNV